jgi:hypothetical protein
MFMHCFAAWSLQNFQLTRLSRRWRNYACQLLLLYRLGCFIPDGFFSEPFLFDNTLQVHNVNNQEIISHGPEVLEKKPARELTVHIDRLAYIFRFD